MFYAIDKITGEIILSINVRSENYKNTYNKSLRYKCGGCFDNGDKCNDNNVSFVNSKIKQSHFRHSNNKECSASKSFKEFNIDFYTKWFNLFKKEYRKPYWYNVNLEQIHNDDTVIMIRYSHQNEKNIKNIEKYLKKDNKIIWILSLKNRNYDKIYFHNGKIYIDFIGNKNDIPLFDNNKSKIYLDTGFNVLLKVKLEKYNSYGQEIKIVYIKDFCKKYDELFLAYPYRYKFECIDNIIKDEKIYNNIIIKLLQEYKNIEEKLKNTKFIIYTLNNLFNIYTELKNLDYNLKFNYYNEYNIILCIKYELKYKETINKKLDKYIILYKNNNLKSNDLDYNNTINNLNEIIYIYNKLINYYINIINTFNHNKNNEELLILQELYIEYNIIIKIYDIIFYYYYIEEYISEYNNCINIINEYDIICYNYLINFFKRQKDEKIILLIQKKKEREKNKKILMQQTKDNDDKNNLILYNDYIEKYKLNGTELIDKLLDIIKNNYDKIKNIKDDYLHKYYLFITHHLNYDILKMIKYINYQKQYF